VLIISDNVWNEIKNIIPTKESAVGRPQNDPRIVLSGIFYIMATGAQWRNLPDYYGRPSSVHGRFMVWAKSGIFEKILEKSIEIAIAKLGLPEAFQADTTLSKAPFATYGGKNPTDRAKNGVKKSVVIDWKRIILSILVDAANVSDSKLLLPHVPSLRRFLEKPKVMATDAAWDIKKLYHLLAQENIALFASTNVRRNKHKRKQRPRGRWRIEQVIGIQQWYRGIKFCWTKTRESFLALCQFASALHNFKLAGIFG
jgi:putative transposase